MGSSAPDEFRRRYHSSIMGALWGISEQGFKIEKINTSFRKTSVQYGIDFQWGVDSRKATQEVRVAIDSLKSIFPEDVRDGVSVWTRRQDSGFYAASFFSNIRSPDEVYKILRPHVDAFEKSVSDAEWVGLYNPNKSEISLELDAFRMASLGLFPRDVERGIQIAMSGKRGGSISNGDTEVSVEVPKRVAEVGDLRNIEINHGKGSVFLSELAQINLRASENDSDIYKTNGIKSLILFSGPKEGGNVKNMSEEIYANILKIKPLLPEDIQFKVLVDPSEFIRHAVRNVFSEVLIGASLAVLILYLFIGSFKNVITAAIEIPISMILAFILMKWSGMNINLISLGGLALSAGMNVDASVVVLENIFRHLEKAHHRLNFTEKLNIIYTAVSEVRFSIIASTIASLVVFVPLAFTSNLANAVLGDLAKTVVFSHGLSAIVALFLVPTVRLHIMRGQSVTSIPKAPLDKFLTALESFYVANLKWFLAHRKFRTLCYLGLLAVLAIEVTFILPKLPKEIIGKPDTDWIVLSASTSGNLKIQQMDSIASEAENKLLKEFGDKISYTFVQIWGPNYCRIMGRLKDKKDMNLVWKKLDEVMVNTPKVRFNVEPFNPAELPLPKPQALKISISGNSEEEKLKRTEEIYYALLDKHVFPRLSSTPDIDRQKIINIKTKNFLKVDGSSLADVTLVATSGRSFGDMNVGDEKLKIFAKYKGEAPKHVEEIMGFPIGVSGEVVPLKALADVQLVPMSPQLELENGQEVYRVTGNVSELNKSQKDEKLKTAKELLKDKPYAVFEDAEVEITDAIKQVGTAIAASALLMLLVLVLQFGSFGNAVLVFVAVPLGFIGALISLYVFKSSLSLNSALGIILLNGIAVANSIILVDFLKRAYDSGLSPLDAALHAGRSRLRPILITSLTTVLGMMPIALGLGEGGRILQPLGITVSGGLWVSMMLTLFVVPALQVDLLNFRRYRSKNVTGWQKESLEKDFQ